MFAPDGCTLGVGPKIGNSAKGSLYLMDISVITCHDLDQEHNFIMIFLHFIFLHFMLFWTSPVYLDICVDLSSCHVTLLLLTQVDVFQNIL